MLLSNPEAVTEINSQRDTPCCAWSPNFARTEGAKKNSKIVCGLVDPQALAYGQFTRLSVAGQRTGGGNHAPGRVGERS